MAPVTTPLFGTSPKTTNREVEHWMNNLNEVQSVIRSVEPKLNSTGGKWKGKENRPSTIPAVDHIYSCCSTREGSFRRTQSNF